MIVVGLLICEKDMRRNLSKFNLELLFLAVLFFMRLASTPTANLSYLLLAVYALFGPARVIRAYCLSWLFTMLNPGLAAEATAGTVGRYAVIAAAVLSCILRAKASSWQKADKTLFWSLALGVFLILHSLAFSPMVDVSVLKALSWTLTMGTLLASWKAVKFENRQLLEKQIFMGLLVILIVSLPFYAIPSIGYLRNGSGFQGILNHPQALGPTMGVLGAWLASRMFAEPKPSWWLVGLLGLCIVAIFSSEARTAGVAMVLGVLLSMALAPLLSNLSFRNLFPGVRSLRVHLVLIGSIFAAILAAPLLAPKVSAYILKRGDSENLVEAYDGSRGGLVREMWSNIEQHPWLGVGFGLASDLSEMEVSRDPVLGLPVGASIEKGVLPLAVLEETGIGGFLAFVMWLIFVVKRAAYAGIRGIAIFSTCLLINMGESTLFSPGGAGLLYILLIAWAATQPKEVISSIRKAV